MKDKKRKEIWIVLALVAIVLLMTVGFASYSQNLNITGNVTASRSAWSVHYVNTGNASNDVDESNGNVTSTAKSLSGTDFSFTVTLGAPGDKYQAEFDVINDGTINAKLNSITMSSVPSYLSYTVKYGSASYTQTTNGINTALNANGTETVTVIVEYILPADSSELPSVDTTTTVTGTLNFVQATT